MIVAAYESHDDARSIAQQWLQKSAGSHRAIARLQRCAGMLLGADAAKELI
jgi:hypothetical protein